MSAKLIAKLEKITVANGATNAEAESAARKVAELRKKYPAPKLKGSVLVRRDGKWVVVEI